MFKRSLSLILGLFLLLATTSTVFASGFAIVEQSVSGLGYSFAGALSGDDSSAMFFNPASISLLEGQQIVAGLHVIVPSAEFTATKAESTPLAGSVSLGTDNGGDGGVTALVPNFYYSIKANDKLSFGLGINAPFGLATDYGKTWVGRYHAVESDVATININPVVAYKVTDQLTLAAGISAEYMDVTLSSMVDGGLISTVSPSNPDYDIFAENTADDWAFGYNLGLMFEFTKDTRVGLAYRSEVKHELKGDIDFQVPSALQPILGPFFVDQGISGDITLPAVASFNIFCLS